MSDILVNIPNLAGWTLKRIDKLCSLVRRGTAPVYVEISKVKAIGQRCVTHQDFDPSFARGQSENTVLNVLKAEPNDVLVNSTGTGTIGRSVIFNDSGEYIIDGHVTVLRPQRELVDSRWLNAVIRSKWFQCHLERFCYTGSTNQIELSRTNLALSVLPTPNEYEQSIIGDVLDVIDNQIRETETIIAKLQQVKRGLLHDLLTHGVDENGELRPSYQFAPEQYKPSELGWIPKDWDVQTIEELGGFVTSGSRDWAQYYSEHGDLFIRIGNLTREHINFRFEKIQYATPPQNGDGQRTKLVGGDILISITADLGIIGVMSDEIGTAYINQHVAMVRFSNSEINPRFIGHFLASQIFQTLLSSKNDAGAKAGLNLPTVRNFPVLKIEQIEQNEITNRLDSMDKNIQIERTNLNKLKIQKSGLMDDLLTGKKRVTNLLNKQLIS